MRYPNLRAEMARCDVPASKLSVATGLSIASVYRRLHGGGFTFEEAQHIQQQLFPAHSIDYLFADESEVMASGQDSDGRAGG